MKIGYARVSTDDQNLDLQRHALKAAGCRAIEEETISGARTSRPVLDALLSRLKKGDVLVVWRLDRLGRSLPHLIEEWASCPSAKTSTPSLQAVAWSFTSWVL
jgi:DNA invertase Pin-like site-specific DNA recombinase